MQISIGRANNSCKLSAEQKLTQLPKKFRLNNLLTIGQMNEIAQAPPLPNFLYQNDKGVFASRTLPANLKFAYALRNGHDSLLQMANADFVRLVQTLASLRGTEVNNLKRLNEATRGYYHCPWLAFVSSCKTRRAANLTPLLQEDVLWFTLRRKLKKNQPLLVDYRDAFSSLFSAHAPIAGPKCCFCWCFGDRWRMSRFSYCHICNAYLYNEYNLMRHISLEHGQFFSYSTNSLPWHCSGCEWAFDTAQTLLAHVGQAHGYEASREMANLCEHHSCRQCECNGRYRCPECGAFFVNLPGLCSHLRSHQAADETSSTTCNVCNVVTPDKLALNVHIDNEHAVNGAQYRCSKCSKVYTTKKTLQSHCSYAHPVYRLVCVYCGRQFPRSDKLKRHLRTHDGRQAFKCLVCHKRFARQDSLKVHHAKVHNARPTAKPERADLTSYIYKCLDCHKGFKRRGMLVKHLLAKHPGKDLTTVPELNVPLLRFDNSTCHCEHCGQALPSAKGRAVHMAKDHPDVVDNGRCSSLSSLQMSVAWPHQCTLCPLQYARKCSLQKHMDKAHRSRHTDAAPTCQLESAPPFAPCQQMAQDDDQLWFL